jgi:hypothetical protein
MSLVLQEVIVAVLVLACALFAAWRLATVRVRLRALDALAAWPLVGASGWLKNLTVRTRARETAACGGCSQVKPDAAARNRTPGALRRS